MDRVEACLASVETALVDADATLTTVLADHEEVTSARLWQGQVLVDWEPDPQAGGCLLRPALLRRLVALHASVAPKSDGMVLNAPGRIVASLSSDHADLVRRLGGSRRVELEVRLGFDRDVYRGGDETYFVLERGTRVALVRLRAEVQLRQVAPASRRTSPSRM